MKAVGPSVDYSQHGEARIILDLLAKLPERNQWCVDVGAGDGVKYSNVKTLIDECGYSALLFDPKYDIIPSNPNVYVYSQHVGFEGNQRLDEILLHVTRRMDFPFDFDFLTIDIDGNDYHVWKALTAFRPKLVCIEFNPTMPSEILFVQKADMNVSHGSSLGSLVELGCTKGYVLVACTPFNAFFVQEQYFPLMGVANNSIRALRKDLSYVTWLFTGYDGTVFLGGMERMPWHPIFWDARQLQVIPRWLREYPGNYSPLKRFVFNCWNWLRCHWSIR